jgi:hypothetical protein
MNAMQRREYPIKDYALIGNCETAGLINPDGGTLALPRRVRGCHFRARCSIPKRAANFHSDPRATIASRAGYVGDTAVLETRFCDGARRRAADGFLCDRARAV